MARSVGLPLPRLARRMALPGHPRARTAPNEAPERQPAAGGSTAEPVRAARASRGRPEQPNRASRASLALWLLPWSAGERDAGRASQPASASRLRPLPPPPRPSGTRFFAPPVPAAKLPRASTACPWRQGRAPRARAWRAAHPTHPPIMLPRRGLPPAAPAAASPATPMSAFRPPQQWHGASAPRPCAGRASLSRRPTCRRPWHQREPEGTPTGVPPQPPPAHRPAATSPRGRPAAHPARCAHARASPAAPRPQAPQAKPPREQRPSRAAPGQCPPGGPPAPRPTWGGLPSVAGEARAASSVTAATTMPRLREGRR